jgi:Kdo2-lipid IVA lauroyltransferase/acyltransferase
MCVHNVHNWSLLKDALALGKGIIFLTPHLGCFEITSIYYGSKHPITVLYRPPKLKFLHKLIEQGQATHWRHACRSQCQRGAQTDASAQTR